MEIVLAKTAGFCFGVKRAVDTVYEEIEKGKKIYTYGPIIHNDLVINDLKQKGVGIIESAEDLQTLIDTELKKESADNATEGNASKPFTVIIRAHGVPQNVYEKLQATGAEIIDATCPFVKKIHNIVANPDTDITETVIVGSKDHPEVLGIRGWCKTPATVIASVEEAQNYIPKTEGKILIVSQTTFNLSKFQDIVEKLDKLGYYIDTVNTICSATKERQNEAENIASEVDAMIVIGDEKSSNSRKLYEICSAKCNHTFFIQTLDDLNLELPKFIPCVGITAGASTPKNIIEEVQNYVRFNF